MRSADQSAGVTKERDDDRLAEVLIETHTAFVERREVERGGGISDAGWASRF
jgi:hypothetical protein